MADSWLPDRGVALHIGLYKTGTTAIQTSLAQSRSDLLSHGMLYPGDHPAHNRQASAVLQTRRGWDSAIRRDESLWRQLVKEVKSHSGKAIVSSEHFCVAESDMARRVIKDLGGDRVRLIVTLRPLEMIIPSSWQQYIKSGLVTPYLDWLDQVLKGEKGKTPSFWKRNDVSSVLQRWGTVIPSDRIAVIVLPSHDRNFLYRSFEEVLGLPTLLLNAPQDSRGNRSLSLNEAEVLRRFNEYAHGTLAYPIFNRTVRQGAGKALVERRTPTPGEKPIKTPRWAVEQARERDLRTAEHLREGGYWIVGELDWLTNRPPLSTDDPADFEIPDDVPIDVAYQLLRGMAERIRR